ncbi:MAG TPA: hypothetical protein VFA28_01980 [Bryobacteraceae bacterium]|jgi:uncharacterized protein YutE (UPF0331/DUF86 family)|nr:hypothetical protein [Bryobacteraceae bacterium]
MEAPFSLHEREALSRFVANIVEEVDKVARLLESRNADAADARAAQLLLQSTLDSLMAVKRMEIRLQPRTPDSF